MVPGAYNFTWYQGTNDDFYLVFKDVAGTMIDLVNHTAKMQVRENYGSESTVIIELSTANGKLIIEPISLSQWNTTDSALPNYIKPTDTGKNLIRIHLLPSDTTSLTKYSGIYDLEITSPTGYVSRPLMGTVTISREVTL